MILEKVILTMYSYFQSYRFSQYKEFVFNAYRDVFLHSFTEFADMKIFLLSKILEELTNSNVDNITRIITRFITIMEMFDDVIDDSPAKTKLQNYKRIIVVYTSFMEMVSLMLTRNQIEMDEESSSTRELLDYLRYSINSLDILDKELALREQLQNPMDIHEFESLIASTIEVRSAHMEVLGTIVSFLIGKNQTIMKELFTAVNNWFILNKDLIDIENDKRENSMNFYCQLDSFFSRQGDLFTQPKKQEIIDEVYDKIESKLLTILKELNLLESIEIFSKMRKYPVHSQCGI